jgi:putative transposase
VRPFNSPTNIVKIFKGVTRLKIQEIPTITSTIMAWVIWFPSYYVGTAGHVSVEVIEKYIQSQQTKRQRKWSDSSTG